MLTAPSPSSGRLAAWRAGAVRCLAASAFWLAAASAGLAQALPPATASAFVDSTAKRLIAVVDGDGSRADQTARLQAIVDGAVDSDGIARFCLGRYWLSATPAQRQAFLDLFHAVLLEGVTGQIRAYKGVTVTFGRVQPQEGGASVSSVVNRPNEGPAHVDWIVGSTAAGPKIVDVVAEGTSLRLTRRNDYAAFLGSHGGNVDQLLAAMRQRVSR